jgi:ribonucleoside-diphosphate reductase beta chain
MAVTANGVTHKNFATTTRGLRREIPPMVLFEKAKRLGIWNPADIDFSQDAKDWEHLTDDQRDYVLYLASQFQAGEEAVTLDLLPLINVIAREGRLEEEMFLTTFLWEEAKHVDFFNRFLTSVGAPLDTTVYHTPCYSRVFYELLPQRLLALNEDPSRENMVRASTTYNLAVEGIMAETGYYMWYSLMDAQNILPGAREGIRNIQLDESRHIAYGVFLISRLIAEDPSLWEIVQEIMAEMLDAAQTMTMEALEKYESHPFGFDPTDVTNFSAAQCEKRLARIDKARGRTLEELYKTTNLIIEEDDA